MRDDQDRLRDALQAAADSADVPIVDWRARLATRQARRRRSRRVGMAGVLAVSALVAGVAIARDGVGGQGGQAGVPGAATTASDPALPADPTASNAPTASDPVNDAPAWEELARPPINLRDGMATAWTDREYIVWGGRTDVPDGAAYDPATDRWRTIADTPLGPRDDAITAWTGSKLIVWGGAPVADVGPPLDDGALYDPDADEWYPMASLPGGGRRASNTVAVWDGSELVVWGGGSGPDDGAAYDPTTNAWRTLPTAPIEWRDAPAGVWTGAELLVWGGSRTVDGHFGNLDDGAAYSPATDTWRALPPAPMQAAVVDAAWTGTHAVFTPGYSGEPTIPLARDTGGVYDPATDSWAPADWLGQHPGTHLVAVGGRVLGIAKGRTVLLAPSTGATTNLGGDDLAGGVDPATVVWTGAQALGLTTDGHGLVGARLGSPAAAVCGSAATPDDPLATTANDPGWTVTPVPLSTRTGAAVAWTGTEYVVWGGTDGTRVFGDGVVVDPSTGTVRTTSPAPIDDRTGAFAVWNGQEVVVAGGVADPAGSAPLTSQPAAAYDPATDTWRLIPRSDVQLDLLGGDSAPTAVWTGTDLVAFATNGAAAFDPVTGLWLALPPLPEQQHFLTAFWDGAELMAVTGAAGAAAVVSAYQPPGTRPANDDIMASAGGSWRQVSASPVGVGGAAAAWTGAQLVIAGGGEPGGSTWGSAAFDLATGEWRELATTPYHPGAELVWTGAEAMLVIKGGYGVLDAATGDLTDGTAPVSLMAGTGVGTGDGAMFLGATTDGACAGGLVVARYRP